MRIIRYWCLGFLIHLYKYVSIRCILFELLLEILLLLNGGCSVLSVSSFFMRNGCCLGD